MIKHQVGGKQIENGGWELLKYHTAKPLPVGYITRKYI